MAEEEEKPVTQKQFKELTADYATKKDLEQFATKKDLERFATKDALEELRAEMNSRFEKMDAKIDELKLLIMSQRAGTELAGEIVPVPAEGVVDSEGDLGAYHRITMAFKRDKGGSVLVIVVAVSKRKVKRWKYD